MINVNQLTQQLRMLPDAVLQRVAQMYKQDPYILPMVVSEGMARKQLRMAGQARAAAPQPKVNDQAVASLGYTPEEVGIAALQAPNMQNMADGGIAGQADDMEFATRSEPVVRMAGGGVPGYAAGTRVRDFEALIRSEAERQGVDPEIALRMFMTETGGEKDATTAVSKKGATGLGQLMKTAAREMGISPDERTDPVKNIQASVGYLKKQLDRYGSYDKALAAYNYGPGNLDKHLARNEGKLNRTGLPQETADYLTKILPIGTATAATAATAAPAAPAAAPTAAPAQSSAFANLGKGIASLADVALSPASFALKQVGYAASRPFLSPAQAEKFSSEVADPFTDVVGKTFGITQDPAYQQEASRRIAGFIGDNINKGSSWIAKQLGIAEEDAANMVNTLTVAAPKVPGMAKEVPAAGRALYERLNPQPNKLTPQQIERMAAEKNAAQIEAAKREAMGAGATLEEQTALEKMMRERREREAPSAAYAIQQQAAQPAPGRIAAGATKVGEQVRAADILARQGEGTSAATAAEAPPYSNEGRNYPTPIKREDATKEDKKEALNTAKDAIPKKERKGLTNDDLLEIGLRMMADPGTTAGGVLSALAGSAGRAGLGALAARKEREKAERDELKELSEREVRQALAKKYEAETSVLESGTRGAQAAIADARQRLADWDKQQGPVVLRDPNHAAMRDQVYQQYLREAFTALGLTVPAGLSSQQAAMPAMPQGVKVRQTG